jgi:branched-chain amino acid transport system ATP-binding protein
MSRTALLSAVAVTKTYGGIPALNQVSLEVGHNEVVGLIGPNGAGKSTLFNCLAGTTRPDSGEITLDGHSLDGLPPHRRARLGLARTFQMMEVFPGLTVEQHLLVAARAQRRSGGMWRDLIGRSKPTQAEREETESLLELLGLTDVADQQIEALSLGRGRVVELARALACQPRLLFLDEPSSGLDAAETEGMADVLEQVRNERDVAILVCEHDVDFVARLASRLVVLDYGVCILEGETASVLAHPVVRAAYIGGQQ